MRTLPNTAVRRPITRASSPRQRGIATLLVVMSLFFLVSMVAAYSSRNLVFEQRTSANQYRSTQAFEVAEGGVEWALALLNGSRVDGSCLATTDTSFTGFRSRYLNINPSTGVITTVNWNSPAGFVALNPSCVRNTAGWVCSCPSAGAPVLADEGGAGVRPAFRVEFKGGSSAPGIFRIQGIGCTANNDACLRLGVGEGAEAASRIEVTVALAPALAVAPAAAITVRGRFEVGGTGMVVVNEDANSNGITIRAGVKGVTDATLLSVAGTPSGQSYVEDASLAALTADRMFATFFGVSRLAFQRQPTTLSFTCGASCADRLRDLVAGNPGRPIWITDTLTLESNVTIGAPGAPVLLVAVGGVDMPAPGAVINGVVYSQAASWPSAGRGSVQGALLSEGDVVGSNAADVRFDPEIINRVRLSLGTVVRVPGGWRDF